MPLIDIAVIGGGPGALHAATELSQRGFQVAVLEEHGDVGENVLCTGIIGAQAFQEFSLPQETVVGSLRQTRVHGRYGTEVIYAPAQPLAYIVDKAALNRALACRAADTGVEIRAHSRAVSIQTGPQQVSIAVQDRAGHQYTLRARHTLARWLDRLLPSWRERPGNRLECKLIAQGGLQQTYAERLLVVGEAAGQTKWTTGGGIYYAILCAQLAVDTIIKAFAHRTFTAATLRGYEQAWQRAMGRELQVGRYFRKVYSRLHDAQVEALLQLAERDGLMDLIQAKADFDWHRELIMALLKHADVRKITRAGLLMSLF